MSCHIGLAADVAREKTPSMVWIHLVLGDSERWYALQLDPKSHNDAVAEIGDHKEHMES